MDVRNCRSCGRLFNYLSGIPICESCKAALEDKFQDVKKYIRDNPRSSVQMVADANEVSTRQIKQWIREERLTFSDDSPIGIDCERCGATIKTGRFCEACKDAMKNDLNSALYREPVEEVKTTFRDGNRMRFLDKN